jgi:hypothetical protein
MGEDARQDATGPLSTERVSVQAAAERLGTTVDAIRKRVQRDTIAHEKDPEGRVWILLETDRTRQDSTGQRHGSDAGELVEALREQVAYLRGVIATRDRELALRGEEIRRRDSALEREQELTAMFAERLRQLDPPRDEPHAPETASEGEGSTQTPTSDTEEPRRSRSWWRRFFGFSE